MFAHPSSTSTWMTDKYVVVQIIGRQMAAFTRTLPRDSALTVTQVYTEVQSTVATWLLLTLILSSDSSQYLLKSGPIAGLTDVRSSSRRSGRTVGKVRAMNTYTTPHTSLSLISNTHILLLSYRLGLMFISVNLSGLCSPGFVPFSCQFNSIQFKHYIYLQGAI